MTDKERIERICKFSGGTWKNLAVVLGVKSTQTFLDIRNDKINISAQLRKRILEEFPQINPEWLNGDANNMLLPKGEDQKNCGRYFPSADEALGYEGAGMVEYPRGCILMLHRIQSVDNILSGNNYVASTADYTVARKVIVEDANTLRLVASDKSLDNGSVIYQDIKVKLGDIVKMYSILGYVMPERVI